MTTAPETERSAADVLASAADHFEANRGSVHFSLRSATAWDPWAYTEAERLFRESTGVRLTRYADDHGVGPTVSRMRAVAAGVLVTAPSGGTTTDAARYKVGARLRVSFEGVVDKDGDFKATGGTYSYVGTPTHEPATPADLVELYGALLQATEGCSTAPAPYTEPREGDRVLIEREPVEGVVAFIGDEPYCHGGDRTAYVDCVSFAAAAAEGRVRLVKAAAPTYEAGRIYRSESEDEWYLYSPDGALALTTSHWVRLSTADWVQDTSVPSDLVPCDVVPREAT